MKTKFFSMASYAKKTFALHSHYIGDTPYLSLYWFEHLLDYMKEIFLRIVIR